MMAGDVRTLSSFLAGGGLDDQAFREMVESLPVAVYTTDADGYLTYFNAAAVRLAGNVPRIGVDRWCVSLKLFDADGAPMPHDQCPMAAALRGGTVASGIECIAERPDGTRRWFTPCPAALRDPRGRIIGGINLLVDITDRKLAEIAADEQFRTIVDATPECVKIVARDGTLLFMNPAGLAMVGAAAADDVVGRSLYDLIAPEDRDRFRDFNERVCRGHKGTLSFDIVGRAGLRRRMESRAVPMRHADGSTVHMATSHDVTARRKAERDALLLAAIVDTSNDAILSKDLDGVIMSWNAGAERIFGYTPEEAVGRPITMLIPEDRLHEEEEILARLRRGERLQHYETVRRRKDGTLFDISLTVSPLRDAAGAVIGASKIARDISERKRADRAIQALNAQLTADLAAMAQIQRLSGLQAQVEELPELLDEIVAVAMEVTDAQMGSVQLVEGGRLRVAAQRGFDAAFLTFFDSVADGDYACGTALLRGRRVIVEDVTASPLFAGSPGLAVILGAGVRAVHATPLISRGGERVGVLSTHYGAPRRPTDRDLRLLDILARQTADLLESKRNTDALRSSEERLRGLVSQSVAGIAEASPDGRFIAANDRYCRITGYTREELLQRCKQDITHPDDAERNQALFRRCVEELRPFEIEKRYLRKDGTAVWVHNSVAPVCDAAGRLHSVATIAIDITERKRAEQRRDESEAALRESGERFRTLADNMSQLAWMADQHGSIFWYNRRWYDYTGTRLEDVEGWGWRRVHHPDHLERVERHLRACFKSGDPWEDTFPLRGADGGYRWFLSRAIPIRDQEGKVLRWFGTNTDITDQLASERALRSANQDLEQFAYSASHDLQEPLRSIKIYSELLTRRYGHKLDGEAGRFLDYLRRGATRMETLVGDLLAYTQITRFDRPAEDADAGAALQAAVSDLAGAIADSGARITADTLPSLPVPAAYLRQLFQNLIGNAIKYCSPDRPPEVHVSAARDNGSWVFAVSDNGIGIDPEYWENIFGLFKRLHTSEEYSGTGIGLAICQRIVDRYHGRIWVESRPGHGSTFRFSLPA